jgi:chemotaxis protein histidine kinase CheA
MGRKKTFRKKRKYKHTNNNNNNNKRTSKKNYKKTYKKRRLMKGGVTGDGVIDPLGIKRVGRFAQNLFGDKVIEKARDVGKKYYNSEAEKLTRRVDDVTFSSGLGNALQKRGEVLVGRLANAAGKPENQAMLYDAGVAGIKTLKTQTVKLFNSIEQELAEATSEEKDAKQEIIELNITKEQLEKEKAIRASAKQKKDAEAEAVKQKELAEAEAAKRQEEAEKADANNELEQLRKTQAALEKRQQEKLERTLANTKVKLEAAEARRLKAISDKERAIKERDELNRQLEEDEEEEENAHQAVETLPPPPPPTPPTAPPRQLPSPLSGVRLPPLPIRHNPAYDADLRRAHSGVFNNPE